MNRITVIQAIIDRKKAQTYLEIGFGWGDCFLNIKVPRKIIVDPNLKMFKKRILRNYIKNLSKNIFNKYYKMKSDDFFLKEQKLFSKQLLDVVFIDGLNTYEQSLKDVLNSLNYLKDDGVIVMHDCNPESEAAAFPANSFEHAASLNLTGWTELWSGDVWKTIVFLRSSRLDLSIFVLDCDGGLGIIKKGKARDMLGYSFGEIIKLSYKELELNREKILNLKSPRYFQEFIETL